MKRTGYLTNETSRYAVIKEVYHWRPSESAIRWPIRSDIRSGAVRLGETDWETCGR